MGAGAQLASGSPGKGGVSRGRGDAALEFGNETPGRTDQFEAQSLPSAKTLDDESTAVVGIGSGAPTVEPVAQAAGDAQVRASSGRTAWKRRLAPHHREAVQEFFGGKKDQR